MLFSSSMQFAELDYSFPFKTINLNNISIAYSDEGSGEQTLLFIHGLSSYIPAWMKNIPVLKNQFRCIAIDLPGYGKSAAGVHSGTMDFYAAIIKEFIQKLELKNVTITGHSMGGQITLASVLRFPELFNKVILLAPAGFEKFTDEERQWLKELFTIDVLLGTVETQIRQNFRRNFFLMPEDAEQMIADRIKMKELPNFRDYCTVVVNSFRGMLGEPVRQDLGKIKNDTLIIFGAQDALIPHPFLHGNLNPTEIGQAGAAQIKNSRLIILNNCGHFIQFEKPHEVNEAIQNFLL